METYSKVTRFFFICNYISRIIVPLASRCAKFRFKPLLEDIMSTRILRTCAEEGLNLDSEALSTLSSISQGDLRHDITFMQSESNGDGSEEDHQEVHKSVKVSKKQRPPQYIAPLSMNRIANLARKNRVTASKASK
ncbi:putative P-loop containing nucleoside triphosphate hydrolase [Helianthus anomalus]